MAGIRLENVCKAYGNETIVENFNLTIPGGIFFALLGPSGCGKTTVLRLIAGLEGVDRGRIFLGDQEITHVPVYKRKINTVFQRYALFPHMTVFDNIAYGLRIRQYTSEQIKDEVHRYIKIFRLDGKQDKFPDELSGGQQQRVALARAVVVKPEVILFDEPLAALDQKLKEQLLVEFSDLQYTLGTTFVYVTHDQNEALTLADEIAIMSYDGKIEQQNSPKNVYELPISRFVADFVGNTNLVQGILRKRGIGAFSIDVPEVGEFKTTVSFEKTWMIPGRNIFASIRPERISINRQRTDSLKNSISAVVKNVIYYGRFLQYRVAAQNGQIFVVFIQNANSEQVGAIAEEEAVFLEFGAEDVVLVEN